jgi:hypothetical protein
MWDVKDHTMSRQSAHRWRWDCQPYTPATNHTPHRVSNRDLPACSIVLQPTTLPHAHKVGLLGLLYEAGHYLRFILMVSFHLRSCMCLRSDRFIWGFPIKNFTCIYYFSLVRCMPSISPSLLESPKSYLMKIRVIGPLPHCVTFCGEKCVKYVKKIIRFYSLFDGEHPVFIYSLTRLQ